MTKYLYGASVQGIQAFIFKTNKLKEIIGGSEIVEKITDFTIPKNQNEEIGFLYDFSKKFNLDLKEEQFIVKAAGNLKIIFDSKEDLEVMVKNFPKFIMDSAYGITISQAVVKLESYCTKKELDSLEQKLKQARNQVELPLDLSLAILENSPRTALPTKCKHEDKEKDKDSTDYRDMATVQKLKASESAKKSLSEKLEFKKEAYHGEFITDSIEEISNGKNKIAVIHIDGNGLGKILQGIGERFKNNPEFKKDSNIVVETYREFSKQLEKSTLEAVEKAFKESFNGFINVAEATNKNKQKLPFRPLIIGGDDVTIICDADYALDFTEKFLVNFEKNSKDNLAEIVKDFDLNEFKNGLTACAGIAFCNEKYPFHYAVGLAEALCSQAKKSSDRKYSCLLFHNTHDSYYADFKELKDKELMISDLSLLFGPYRITESQQNSANLDNTPTIQDLRECFDAFMLKDEGSSKDGKKITSPLSSLRGWLSDMYDNPKYADSVLKRINQMAGESGIKKSIDEKLKNLNKDLKLDSLIVKREDFDEKKEKKEICVTPIFDILQLKSVQS